MNYKKRVGYAGENIVAEHYRQQGFTILEQNYTIRGGEIDIIAMDEKNIAFVEVKVINNIDDIQSFITNKKLYYLEKTIQQYILTHSIPDKDRRLDVAFVKNDQIVDIFINVT